MVNGFKVFCTTEWRYDTLILLQVVPRHCSSPDHIVNSLKLQQRKTLKKVADSIHIQILFLYKYWGLKLTLKSNDLNKIWCHHYENIHAKVKLLHIGNFLGGEVYRAKHAFWENLRASPKQCQNLKKKWNMCVVATQIPNVGINIFFIYCFTAVVDQIQTSWRNWWDKHLKFQPQWSNGFWGQWSIWCLQYEGYILRKFQKMVKNVMSNKGLIWNIVKKWNICWDLLSTTNALNFFPFWK